MFNYRYKLFIVIYDMCACVDMCSIACIVSKRANNDTANEKYAKMCSSKCAPLYSVSLNHILPVLISLSFLHVSTLYGAVCC